MTQSSTRTLAADADALLAARRPGEALAVLEPVLQAGQADPSVLNVAARALNNLGRLEEAADLLRQALRIDAVNLQALTNLGHVCARLREPGEAAAAWQQALGIDPGHGPALKGLGRLAAEAGRLEEAAGYLQRAAELDPSDADNWLNLAEIMQFLERPAAAEAAYRQAVTNSPDRAEAQEGLGRLLYSAGSIVEAAEAYRAARRIDPKSAASAAGLALCLEVIGEREQGMQALSPFMDLSDPDPAVDYAAGRLLAADGRLEESARRLGRSVESDDPHWSRNPAPWYVLGGVLDRLGRHDEAFAAWTQANLRKPARFDLPAFSSRVEAIIDHFGDVPAQSGSGDPRPVFIVGMPRSGTTLIEQILACHPQVHAGGEQLALQAIADRLWEDGRRVDSGAGAQTAKLREEWLSAYGAMDARVTRFTDKYPANFMHLGLASRLFPDALVVWCRRDPGDTALSVFANDFNRNIVPWATRLEDIGAVWSEQERLMRHWEQSSGLRVIRVQYEHAVEETEAVIRQLLDELGLAWEPRCLEFHKSGRLANTASFDQVRRPVYSSSVGRARPYRSQLQPFFRAIRP